MPLLFFAFVPINAFQGSLALTCYNSTRVSESHTIEYKSHETSEQACADACTANDKVHMLRYLPNSLTPNPAFSEFPTKHMTTVKSFFLFWKQLYLYIIKFFRIYDDIDRRCEVVVIL